MIPAPNDIILATDYTNSNGSQVGGASGQDDTTGLQAFINDCAKYRRPGRIPSRPFSYKTGTLYLTYDANNTGMTPQQGQFTIFGDGMVTDNAVTGGTYNGCTVLEAIAAGHAPLVIHNSNYAMTNSYPSRTVTISDLSIIANNDNTFGISGITKANPCVVSFSGTNPFSVNDLVFFDGITGMTELNAGTSDDAYVVTATTSSSITLGRPDGSAVDSTAYTTWGGAGTVIDVRNSFAVSLTGFTISSTLKNVSIFNRATYGSGLDLFKTWQSKFENIRTRNLAATSTTPSVGTIGLWYHTVDANPVDSGQTHIINYNPSGFFVSTVLGDTTNAKWMQALTAVQWDYDNCVDATWFLNNVWGAEFNGCLLGGHNRYGTRLGHAARMIQFDKNCKFGTNISGAAIDFIAGWAAGATSISAAYDMVRIAGQWQGSHATTLLYINNPSGNNSFGNPIDYDLFLDQPRMQGNYPTTSPQTGIDGSGNVNGTSNTFGGLKCDGVTYKVLGTKINTTNVPLSAFDYYREAINNDNPSNIYCGRDLLLAGDLSVAGAVTADLTVNGQIVADGGIDVGGVGQSLVKRMSWLIPSSGTGSVSFGTVNANTVKTMSASLSGVIYSSNWEIRITPHADPGASLIWSVRIVSTGTIEIRLANPTGSNIVTTNVGWRVTAEQNS